MILNSATLKSLKPLVEEIKEKELIPCEGKNTKKGENLLLSNPLKTYLAKTTQVANKGDDLRGVSEVTHPNTHDVILLLCDTQKKHSSFHSLHILFVCLNFLLKLLRKVRMSITKFTQNEFLFSSRYFRFFIIPIFHVLKIGDAIGKFGPRQHSFDVFSAVLNCLSSGAFLKAGFYLS